MKSGIYTITNTANNLIYVGYSENIYKREYYHYKTLEKGCHSNIYLQKDYNLYGRDSFIFEKLVECEIALLPSEEHYWATILNVHNKNYGYNIAPTNPNGEIIISSETKKRMSNAKKKYIFSEEHKKNLSISASGRKWDEVMYSKLKGRKRTTEICKKISRSLKGRKLSEETIIKYQNNNPGNKAVLQYSIDNVLLKEYISISQAERITGIKTWNISNHIKTGNTSTGFIWKFKNH